MVTLFFSRHYAADKFSQVIVRSPATHQLMQIVVPDREQASANLSVGSDSNPAAVSAEWMRHWRNDADFSNSIVEAIPPRRFAAPVRNLNQRPIFPHSLQDFIERNHDVRRPDPVLFKRHELDEAHDHAFFAREHS